MKEFTSSINKENEHFFKKKSNKQNRNKLDNLSALGYASWNRNIELRLKKSREEEQQQKKYSA